MPSICTFLAAVFLVMLDFIMREESNIISLNYFFFENKTLADVAERQSPLGPALASFQLDSRGCCPFPVKHSRGLWDRKWLCVHLGGCLQWDRPGYPDHLPLHGGEILLAWARCWGRAAAWSPLMQFGVLKREDRYSSILFMDTTRM